MTTINYNKFRAEDLLPFFAKKILKITIDYK